MINESLGNCIISVDGVELGNCVDLSFDVDIPKMKEIPETKIETTWKVSSKEYKKLKKFWKSEMSKKDKRLEAYRIAINKMEEFKKRCTESGAEVHDVVFKKVGL